MQIGMRVRFTDPSGIGWNAMGPEEVFDCVVLLRNPECNKSYSLFFNWTSAHRSASLQSSGLDQVRTGTG
jgi:hypothetical protein